jgi:hypothetical protein
MKRAFVNAFGLALTWAAWLWLASRQLAQLTSLSIALAGTLAVIPLVLAGRWLLDQQPTLEQAEWVTTGVHYLVALFLGSAIIGAVQFGFGASTRLAEFLPSWLDPAAPRSGVMLISGLCLLVVFNLAIGNGRSLCHCLTRVVATDWLRLTRNPMV